MLKGFNCYWWKRVLPEHRGSPNYEIGVSHNDHKKWIPVNYDLFMTILLDDNWMDDSESEKKGYQREEELVSLKEMMMKINYQMQTEYKGIFYQAKSS